MNNAPDKAVAQKTEYLVSHEGGEGEDAVYSVVVSFPDSETSSTLRREISYSEAISIKKQLEGGKQ